MESPRWVNFYFISCRRQGGRRHPGERAARGHRRVRRVPERCPTNSQKTYDCDPVVLLQGNEDSDSDDEDAFTALVAARIKAVPIEGAGGTPQATPKKRRRGEQA